MVGRRLDVENLERLIQINTVFKCPNPNCDWELVYRRARQGAA